MLPLFALYQDRTLEQALMESAPVAVFTLAGSLPFHRRLRAVSVTLGLLLSSAILVDLSGGLAEMHFHVFVMIPIIALYQDWLPFGVAVSFVLLHRGVIATLVPEFVFETGATPYPWRLAALHAFFVAALSAVCIAGWRINELVLERQKRAEQELLEEKRIVETLHDIGTAVVSELDMDRVSQLVTDAAAKATGAHIAAFFYNVEDAQGESFMLYTLSGTDRSAFASFPMPRNTKVFGPTFAGTGIVRSDDITKDERYGHNAPYNGMPPGHPPVRSYLAVPVRSRGSSEVLGGLFFGHPAVGVFDERDERIVVGIATQAAIAFDNARLYQAEREAHEAAEDARTRVSMLADAGRVLVESLEPDETMEGLAHIAVPDFADLCIVDMVQPDGSLHRVDAIASRGLERAATSLKPYPPDPSNDDHPIVAVMRGSGPILTSQVTPEGTSSIVVPLVGRSDVLGVVSFLTAAASGRLFTEHDIPLAEALGRRAGMAVENARLYQAERDARAEASKATTNLSLLAEAGRMSATLLNEEVRIQQLAQVTVPVLADACLIDIVEEDGSIRRVAAAASGYAGFAEQIVDYPPDPKDRAHPVVKVMHGEPSVLIERIDDSFLRAVTQDDSHRSIVESAAVGSTVIVPLIARGGIYGALSLIDFVSSGRGFAADDVPLAEEIGRRAGVAVHNARMYHKEREAVEAAESAAARIALLSEASRVLGSSLDTDETLQNVANLAVPTLADLCVIDLQDTDGQIRRVAASGAPGLESVAQEVKDALPLELPADHPVARVAQGEGTQYIEHVSPEMIRTLSDDEGFLMRAERMNVLSAVMVPVTGRATTLGVMSLATTPISGRTFPPQDIPLAEELARRAGVAIENATLYAQQRGVAEELQHALLPHDLPSIPGFEVTARYQPGGPGERVGGDWYDLFEIPSGELAVVMGDVVGHGIPAASLMAQLRNALRAYVWDGRAPSEVLARLNQLLYGLEKEGMATASLCLLDPIASTLRVANAGHPPFLRLPEGGDPRFVGEGLGPPLGAVPFASFREEVLQLEPQDTLVLYTDGLVEDRASSLDIGLERMRAAASDAEADIDMLCDGILKACLGDRVAEDDVAVMVIRAQRMGAKLQLHLPAEPRVLSSLRQTLRRWMREHHVPDKVMQDVLVATGEACNNAIEHGAAPLGGWFEVEAEIDGDLNVVVRSTGDWRAPREDGGGRGLPVMEALMDHVDVDHSGQGIVVRMLRRLNGTKVRP